MNFKELCQARYSCRQYKNEPVPQEKMDYIKECVRLAPSAVNLQPWRFIVICLKREEEAWTRRYDGRNHADIDIAIATEHLCLAASEQGLGNCWVCNFDVEKLIATGLIPEGYTPSVLVPLGFPADEPKEKTRKATDEIWY